MIHTLLTATLSATMSVTPATATLHIGQPIQVEVVIQSTTPFNAAQANIILSNNLKLKNVTAGNCNFTFIPTVYSFTGAILGGSSTDCVVETLTLNPTKRGTATVTLTDGQVKAYTDASELLGQVQNGSYTVKK